MTVDELAGKLLEQSAAGRGGWQVVYPNQEWGCWERVEDVEPHEKLKVHFYGPDEHSAHVDAVTIGSE